MIRFIWIRIRVGVRVKVRLIIRIRVKVREGYVHLDYVSSQILTARF